MANQLKDFFNIEKTLDFSYLKFKNANLWSYYRNYYSESYLLNNDPGRKVSSRIFKEGIKNIFKGIIYLFGSYKYIAVISSDQRRKIGNKSIHPFDYLPKDILELTLFIELPVGKGGHSNKNELIHKQVSSRYILILLEYLLIKFTKLSPPANHIENMQLIQTKLKTHLDFIFLYKRFVAGYKVFSLLLRIFKPEAVFCTVSYTIKSYVVAAKEHNVPVIEMQHGFIGKTHRAYNVPVDIDVASYPDFLLSWGRYEKTVFSADNYFINEDKVLPVGSFYLSYINKQKANIKNGVVSTIKNTNYLVAVALQDPLEDIFIPFILRSAAICDEIGYLLLPRAKSHQYYRDKYELPPNVILNEKISTYEGIVIADVHSTIWSTTAIEAIGLGCKNIIINYENKGKQILGDILSEEHNTWYASTPDEFVKIVMNKISSTNQTIDEKYFFIDDFENRMQDVVNAVITEAERR